MKHSLPETGYVRLSHIVGDPKAEPPIPAVIPVSKSTWWQGVKTGRFPRPVKLGPRITAWRVEDIRSLIERIDELGADMQIEKGKHGKKPVHDEHETAA